MVPTSHWLCTTCSATYNSQLEQLDKPRLVYITAVHNLHSLAAVSIAPPTTLARAQPQLLGSLHPPRRPISNISMVGVYAMQLAGNGALKLAPSSNSHACRTTSGAALAPRRPNYVTMPASPAYRRKVTTMGNKGENGPFAPLVR